MPPDVILAMDELIQSDRGPDLSDSALPLHALVQQSRTSRSNPPHRWLYNLKSEVTIVSSFLEGVVFWLRFQWGSHDPVNLDRCIACWQHTFQLRSRYGIARALVASSLGTAYSARMDYSGDLDDLDRAIELHQAALEDCPVGHRWHVLCLNNLGDCLGFRYAHRSVTADIDLSIKLLTESLELCPPLNRTYLGAKVRGFFRQLGAVGFFDDHTNSLLSLGGALLERYKQSDGHSSDIQRAIDLIKQAVEHCPLNHPRAIALDWLARTYEGRFEKEGDIKDMQYAVELLKQAVALVPQGHQDYYHHLTTLATAHLTYYQWSGEIDDIEKAMEQLVLALKLCPRGHPQHCMALGVYAEAHRLRFEALGNPADLHSCIDMFNETLELSPPDQHFRAGVLLSLSGTIQTRLAQFGIMDLDRAIQLARRGSELLPSGHPNLVHCLVILADTELQGFIKLGNIEYMDRAIQTHLEVKKILTATHPWRAYALDRFAKALIAQFEFLHNMEHLETAIELYMESLELCPPGHHWRGYAQEDLACALVMRYRDSKNAADIQQAITLHQSVIKETWISPNPNCSISLGNLADALFQLYQHSQAQNTLKEAMETYKAAVTYPYSSARIKMGYVLEWLKASQLCSLPEQASIAYPLALDLLPQMIGHLAHLPVDSRSKWGRDKLVKGIPCDAAMHALLFSKEPERAVELIEQGRGMFWNQGLKLRTHFDGLPESLQQKLKHTAYLLETDTNHGNQFKGFEGDQSNNRIAFLKEQEANKRRELVEKFDELVKQARQIKGFENLLMPKKFQEISKVAKYGPVVVLLASSVLGCAGVLIHGDSNKAVHIPLPQVTVHYLEELAEKFTKVTSNSRGKMEPDISESPEFDEGTRKMMRTKIALIDPFIMILQQLWKDVVAPIIQVLDLKKPSDMSHRPRLWWCPTGPFALLPIHAAGINFQKANCECTSDYIVSSYIPTLRALLDAQDAVAHRSVTSTSTKALLLAQPATPNLPPLPNTIHEIEMLSKLFPDDALLHIHIDSLLPFTESNSSVTIAEVVEKIPEASILHLACHGNHDQANPLESGFAFQDGVLNVDSLIKLKTPHAFFAFLSACETASGDPTQPDENIHLAAAMLFAGFQSVVATMWSMRDSDGPEIAQNVYQRMMELGGATIDPGVIAYALDEGVRKLRSRGASPSQWAPYIHLGV